MFLSSMMKFFMLNLTEVVLRQKDKIHFWLLFLEIIVSKI